MKKGCLVTVIVLVGLIALLAFGLFTAFDPEYDKVEIKQAIGGTLICSSVYSADHHSWQYDVSYKYKTDKDSIIDLGGGTYYGREWSKDEQLIQYRNWTILKTGGWIGTDKIIIGDIKAKKWTEYEFTPENIEKSSLWESSKTKSLLNWCCAETFIEEISNGQIVVYYKFRTSEKQVDKYGQKRIYYTINQLTGQPVLTKIE